MKLLTTALTLLLIGFGKVFSLIIGWMVVLILHMQTVACCAYTASKYK